MLEDLGHIEDIEPVSFGKDKRIPHQELKTILIVAKGEVVIGIGGVELIIHRIVQD